MKPTVRSGACSTPRCTGERIEGRRFCSDCSANLARIKKELKEHPALLYNQRTQLRSGADGRRQRRPPTCCYPGCFELRNPLDQYCYKGELGHEV